MKRVITIEFFTPDHVFQEGDERGYLVTESGRNTGGLSWDELLGQIAELTHPSIRKARYEMHTAEEWQMRLLRVRTKTA